jgi:hypothetical protein
MTSVPFRAMLATTAVTAVVLSPLLTAAPAAGSPRAATAARTASVYVVQGVAGASVAVSVDGSSVSQAMAAKAVSSPVRLGYGMHTAVFRADDWTVRTKFRVDAQSVDLVLHWQADKGAKPEAELFVNDLRPVATHHGRLSVAHTAVVPPADVRVDKKVVFANIANGEFVTSNVPAGNYSVDIVPTGQDGKPLFGPVDLPVAAGLLTRVFAIGEPRHGGMQAVVQTLPVSRTGSSAPDQVNAGSAGLVSPSYRAAQALGTPSSPDDVDTTLLLVVAFAGAALGGFVMRRRMRQQR